jgi:hypothetical protein
MKRQGSNIAIARLHGICPGMIVEVHGSATDPIEDRDAVAIGIKKSRLT